MLRPYCFFLHLGQLFVVSFAFTQNQPDYFLIIMNDKYVIQGSELNILEGNWLELNCKYARNNNVPTVWLAGEANKNASVFPTDNNTLTLESVRRNQIRQYSCATLSYYRNIHINVLYPPEETKIEGPLTVSKYSSFNLTCFAEATPPALYWWANDASCYAPNISTDATISIHHAVTDMSLYCVAYNLMVPTVGPPVHSRPKSAVRHILVEGTSLTSDENNVKETEPEPNVSGWIAVALFGMTIATIAVVIALLQTLRIWRLQEHYRRLDETSILASKMERMIPAESNASVSTQTSELIDRPKMLTPEEMKAANTYPKARSSERERQDYLFKSNSDAGDTYDVPYKSHQNRAEQQSGCIGNWNFDTMTYEFAKEVPESAEENTTPKNV